MKNQIIKLSGSIICIFLIFTMIFNSCKEDEDDTPDEPEVVIPETTKIISNEDWQSNIIGSYTNQKISTRSFNCGLIFCHTFL